MDSQIPETWVQAFLSKITEGSVYYIKYFQVRNARDLYRPVDQPCLMRFTAHTKVYEIKPIPPQFPQYAYNLATFEVLNNRINKTACCSGMHSQLAHLHNICLLTIRTMSNPYSLDLWCLLRLQISTLLNYTMFFWTSYTIFADAIGVLKGCSHVKLQNTAKGTKPLRNVDIINENW